ncbi:MAG: hypothetical protein AAB074_05315 [Planctomycetota bacterium]
MPLRRPPMPVHRSADTRPARGQSFGRDLSSWAARGFISRRRMSRDRLRRSPGERATHFSQPGSRSERAILSDVWIVRVELGRFTRVIVTTNSGNQSAQEPIVFIHAHAHSHSKIYGRCPDPEAAEVRSFVSSILADSRVDLPRAVALDVGVIRGRGWAATEVNAAWGSGIYGCDPAQVLEVLRFASDPA